MPKLCPSCGSHLHYNQETIIIHCDNGLNFPAPNHERICHFSSIDALNIDGLGKTNRIFIEGIFDKIMQWIFYICKIKTRSSGKN
jgi:NAD-dependent DNA ligase